MKHWVPDRRPDAPPPMARWILVALIWMGGMFLSCVVWAVAEGAAIVAAIALAGSALCAGYVQFRIREAGWP